MTKRQASLTPTEQHACEECIHATYDTDERNRNIQTGEPILVICALHPFPKIVVGSLACENYKQKNKSQ